MVRHENSSAMRIITALEVVVSGDDSQLRGFNFPIAIDPTKLLFSLSSFFAACLTLSIAFTASLPRPWWALLTVYVTAQPMSGAFRPKVLYRIAGILTGAVVTIVLVPNLQNSPILLVFCLAAWTGFCIYLAVLDRTPRAFLFQMAAFSSAVISFPYLDDPANIFMSTISRVEEMTVAILCVTVTHMVLQPWNVRPVIRARAHDFLHDASVWTIEAMAEQRTPLEYEHRRRLAADIVELGMIAINLPFDTRYASATRETVASLQQDMAAILPLATAAADRLDHMRKLDAIDDEIEAIVADLVRYLDSSPEAPASSEKTFLARCRTLAADRALALHWTSLLAASLLDRIAALVDAMQSARLHVLRLDGHEDLNNEAVTPPAPRFPLARDHGLAALAGAATATAIILYCAVWILLAWPNGSATAAFAALITCSFAAQDDPAPVIGRYLIATFSTFPLAAVYLFAILPRVDGAAMLILTLAPALLWMGYIQADPARSARALPMFSCFIVAMGFLDRFQADFANFLNTGIAQVAGIVATLGVTRLFRSANSRWTARRIIRANWLDLERLTIPSDKAIERYWTARAVDRLGQIAARMALAAPGDALHAADGLGDLRIGRNLIQLRHGIDEATTAAQDAVQAVLAEARAHFRMRVRRREPVAPNASLLDAIDRAISTAVAARSAVRLQALTALVGMRCNLFPGAPPFGYPLS